MLQAWIASPSGSLYFAAEATQGSLQELRDHLRGMRRFKADELRLSLTLGDDDDDTVVEDASELIGRLADEGVAVSFFQTTTVGIARAQRRRWPRSRRQATTPT